MDLQIFLQNSKEFILFTLAILVLMGLSFIPFHMMFQNKRSLLVTVLIFAISFAYPNFSGMIFYYVVFRLMWIARKRVWFYMSAPSAAIVGAHPGLVNSLKRTGLTWTRRFCFLWISCQILGWGLVAAMYLAVP